MVRPSTFLTSLALIAFSTVPPVWSSGNHLPDRLRLPFTYAHTGPGTSPWIRLDRGLYDVVERNNPAGCAARIVLTTRRGYSVVDLHPNFVPGAPRARGGVRWAGYTTRLTEGVYRIKSLRVTARCRWQVRIVARGR